MYTPTNRIRAVEITFENFDYIVIPHKYFEFLMIKGLDTRLERLDEFIASVHHSITSVEFRLSSKADSDATTFEGDIYELPQSITLFERIRRHDITSLTLIYANGFKQTCSVLWKNEKNNEFCNSYQKERHLPGGDFHVKISRSTITDPIIASREAAERMKSDGFLLKNAAVISFHNPDSHKRPEAYKPVDYEGFCDTVFYVPIHDIDPDILEEHGLDYDSYFPEADALAEFINDAVDARKRIICQCDYGQSRSAACAAAIKEYFTGNGIDIFSDYTYYPNQMVFNKVLQALQDYEIENY